MVLEEDLCRQNLVNMQKIYVELFQQTYNGAIEMETMETTETKPMVSVIVPVRNGEKTVGELLDSLLKVDYPKEKLEIIVVDGNSTDRTRKIVSKYPFELILQEGNGLNAARNTGIKHSNGQIIAFTDADCVVPEDWIKKIVEDFRDLQVGCIGGSVKGDGDGFFSRYADESVMPAVRAFKKREVLDNVKLLFCYPAGCNMAFRREAFEKVGGFDETIVYSFDEDELVEKVCKAGYKMVIDPDVLIKHKHRSTLKELLKQTFKYGRGSGFLLRRRWTKTVFSTWFLFCLIGFITWLFILATLTISTVTTRSSFLSILLLSFVFAPFFGFMLPYGYKALKNRHYEMIFIYPFLDFLRILTFCTGQLFQFFQTRGKEKKL